MKSASILGLAFASLVVLSLAAVPAAPSMRLLFKNGDRISGAFTRESLEVTTAAGTVRVNTADVARIAYGHARHKRDTVILKNGDRISGEVGPASFAFTTAAGEKLEVGKSALAGIETVR